MTRDEIKKALMVIQAAYPNYKPPDKEITVNTWYEILSGYECQQVMIALKAYIAADNKGFAPSIGQIIEKMQMINKPCELNEMEAWALVSKALRNGYYGAEEEFAKLPPVVQKAVGAPDQLRNWAVTEGDSIENVIQSNFMRTYRAVLHREQEVSKMPAEIRNLINQDVTMRITEQEPGAIEERSTEPAEYKPEENPPDQLNKLIEKLARGLGRVL